MYANILLAVDGSDDGGGAVSRALALARHYEATVHVLYVVDTTGLAGVDETEHARIRRPHESAGREATQRVYQRAADLGIDATRTVLEGSPYRVLLDYANEHNVDLIVMATHGRTGPERVALGSTTERVVTLTDRPVLAVPITDADGEDIDSIAHARVVIATDGSDAAARAAERGMDIAEAFDAAVSVTYVIDTRTYDLQDSPRSIIGLLREGGEHAVETIADAARDRGLSVHTEVRRGIPHDEVTAHTDAVDGDLLVIGTRGRGGAAEDLLGSTAARLLRRTALPVLAVG